MATVDEISPAYVGEDRLTLSLESSLGTPATGSEVRVNVDYSGADPEGVVLPLEFVVSAADYYFERVFRKIAPSSVSFQPIVAGPHLVLLREAAHNRWQGRLVVDVQGDDLQRPTTSR